MSKNLMLTSPQVARAQSHQNKYQQENKKQKIPNKYVNSRFHLLFDNILTCLQRAEARLLKKISFTNEQLDNFKIKDQLFNQWCEFIWSSEDPDWQIKSQQTTPPQAALRCLTKQFIVAEKFKDFDKIFPRQSRLDLIAQESINTGATKAPSGINPASWKFDVAHKWITTHGDETQLEGSEETTKNNTQFLFYQVNKVYERPTEARLRALERYHNQRRVADQQIPMPPASPLEQFYLTFVDAHVTKIGDEIQHHGRDTTTDNINKVHSSTFIKELIADLIKACPHCSTRDNKESRQKTVEKSRDTRENNKNKRSLGSDDDSNSAKQMKFTEQTNFQSPAEDTEFPPVPADIDWLPLSDGPSDLSNMVNSEEKSPAKNGNLPQKMVYPQPIMDLQQDNTPHISPKQYQVNMYLFQQQQNSMPTLPYYNMPYDATTFGMDNLPFDKQEPQMCIKDISISPVSGSQNLDQSPSWDFEAQQSQVVNHNPFIDNFGMADLNGTLPELSQAQNIDNNFDMNNLFGVPLDPPPQPMPQPQNMNQQFFSTTQDMAIDPSLDQPVNSNSKPNNEVLMDMNTNQVFVDITDADISWYN